MISRVRPEDQALAAPIRLILSDVDGVLTDGQIIYDNSGVETKCFHVRDGLGIKLWQRAGYHFAIVTSRTSDVVRHRAAELGIRHVRQGVADKWQVTAEILRSLDIPASEACYIGDDLPDLAPMRRVALPVAVGDAAEDVRQLARWTTRLAGGQGAVRELIERLLKAKAQWDDFVNP
jgi:YrbI family 3-deoxy-D-manno-octulosonate 8-phosphate phosphatase